jgi:hypothetical protein
VTPVYFDWRDDLDRARRHVEHVREQLSAELSEEDNAVAQSRRRIESSLKLLRRLRVHQAAVGQVAQL